MSKELKFENITPYQLGLCRSIAVDNYVKGSIKDGPTVLIKTTFEMIAALGYKIVKDENCKEPGYQEPTKAPVDPKEIYGYWYNRK